MNARVFGVSVQDTASHKGFAEKNTLNFHLLADPGKQTTAEYDVLAGPGYAKRYTYYIDPLGILRKIDDKVKPFSAGKDAVDNLKLLEKTTPMPTAAQLNASIRELGRTVSKNPGDAAASDKLALALYLRGRATMTDASLPPRTRNPAALKLFDRALKLNPDLAAAEEDRAAVTKSMRT